MGGVGGGVRVDVNEIEVFVKKYKKKKFWGGVGGGRRGGGVGVGLGGQSGCERRMKFCENSKKKKIFFLGGGWSGGGGGRWGVGGRVGGSEWM